MLRRAEDGPADDWTRYKATGDVVIRNRLVERYLPLVEFLADRILQRLPRCVEVDDLRSAGTFGLMAAIDGFDLSRGIKFETYCSVRVRGAILDELRSRDWVPRVVRSRAQRRERTECDLATTLGRPASQEEVAERLGWTLSEVTDSHRAAGGASVLSLGGGEDASERLGSGRLDGLEDYRGGADPVARAHQRDVAALVYRALTPKERQVVVLYYFEQITMREIGRILGLSESRVCQIHARVLRRLRERMESMREELLSK